jgi:hypothetical protein
MLKNSNPKPVTKPTTIRAIKGVREPEQKALKFLFRQPILPPEDTIPPKFAYKTNSFTDQAHFSQHMKHNRTGEVGRPATV